MIVLFLLLFFIFDRLFPFSMNDGRIIIIIIDLFFKKKLVIIILVQQDSSGRWPSPISLPFPPPKVNEVFPGVQKRKDHSIRKESNLSLSFLGWKP